MAHPLGLAIAALGLAFGAGALFIGGWGSGAVGPRAVPLLGAAVLLLSGLAIAFSRSDAAPAEVLGAGSAWDERERGDGRRVAWLLALAVLYVLAIDRVGYLAATGLAAPAFFAVFGLRRPTTLVAVAVLLPLALHVVFFRLLGVFPPVGAWFDVLDVVPL